ncbi:MAG TPA: radical SAM protein [Candidatus Hydrogenedentes bacterium]|nr:radical SAM protein [Candidatus Hydrogenedentota bacterium]HPG65437.1 radical SAM protein [Candidatus Hydrogenedentota bacterium]
MKRVRIFLANVGLRRPLYPLVTPPMGLLYLAAYLRQRFDADIRVVTQKLDNCSNDHLVRQAQNFGADVVGLSALTPAAYGLNPITAGIRRALPEALIVLGGPHVSSFGIRSLDDNGAHAAVAGEGELAFEAILREYFEGGSLANVPGLFWRSGDGETVANPGAVPPIMDLDSLPFPAYDLIDVPAFWRRQSMPPIPRRKYVSLFSSRGCPYHCNYCHRIFGKVYRVHSAERIVDEIAFFQHKYGVQDFEFLDDIFNLDHRRVIEFCDLVHRRNLHIKIAFPNAVRGDILTEEEIAALKDAGMYFCSFALESGSPRIQQVMGKRLDIPRFVNNIALTAAKGVFTNGFNMLGFPTETAADMQMTIDVASQSRLHTASFFTVTPFPNTDVYNTAMQLCPDQIAKLDYTDMDFGAVAVNLSAEPDDVLFRYQREANRRFFLKTPSRLFRMIRDFPQPHLLPLYLPHFIHRATKGQFGSHGSAPIAPAVEERPGISSRE